MKNRKIVALSGSIALFAAASIGTPVAADTKADLTLVNGIPSKAVDVCVGKKEVRSGLRYGGKTFKRVGVGAKKVTFRVKSPGRCKGNVLARKTITLGNEDDYTLVAIKRGQKKVVAFDNDQAGSQFFPSADPLDTALVWRHAANIRDVGFVIGLAPIDVNYWEHAGDIIWNKGDQRIDQMALVNQPYISVLSVVAPFSELGYAGPTYTDVYPGYRYEWIFVGTNERNAKIVKILREIQFLVG